MNGSVWTFSAASRALNICRRRLASGTTDSDSLVNFHGVAACGCQNAWAANTPQPTRIALPRRMFVIFMAEIIGANFLSAFGFLQRVFIDEQQERPSSHNYLSLWLLLRKRVLNIFRADNLAPWSTCFARGQNKFDSILGCIHDQQKAVVDDRLTVLVRNLECLPIQQHTHSTIPIVVPGSIGNMISIGVEPGEVHHRGILSRLPDFAILEKLPAVQVWMRKP